MRSDYIGQCAAFRGLPEFIGFSQFFVPRLQRKELQQVIEEPAILSGNRISKRLVDRLIYDLEDTEDHLPILQHVLKEIWKAADRGSDEMDLIHYAMVGGMPGQKLPKEDADRFQRWEAQLSPQHREFLKSPGLLNVLDIHATRLYSEAAALYNQGHGEPISEKDARLIIAIPAGCSSASRWRPPRCDRRAAAPAAGRPRRTRDRSRAAAPLCRTACRWRGRPAAASW